MSNVIAYNSQILLLIAAMAGLPWLFRVHAPAARLWFWQGVLAVCLLLPFIQTRKEIPPDVTIAENPLRAGTPVKVTSSRPFPVAETLLAVYVCGVLGRAAWLVLGCLRLRRYRRQAIDLYPISPALVNAQKGLMTFPDIRLSTDVSSPVTFGLLSPVILLPPDFLELDESSQVAIAVHELMHVRRNDWAFSISEEIVRSIFWFHPAIWWLLAQIQLTREQVVDRATIEFTLSREQYLEALLAVAKTKVRPDLALAPLFLKKRHLARRVAEVMKEVRMSKRQTISTLATVFTLALVTARVAVWVFPMQSFAQESRWDQSAGVTVDTQGRKILHGGRVEYPQSAREKRIEGTVVLQVGLDAKGEVTDARVESGPEELRNAALSAALQWHFANDSGQPVTIPVLLSFKIPSGVDSGSKTSLPELHRPSTVKAVVFGNLPEDLAKTVQSRLQLRAGDSLTTDSLQTAVNSLRQIDEHLRVHLDPNSDSTVVVISLAGVAPARSAENSIFNPPPTEGVRRVRLGGNVIAAKLTDKVTPAYPPLAKQARIQGTVRYNVLIGKEGTIKALELVAGHPLLVEMATPAVSQWKYQPTLLNGEPAEVITTVDVNFTLTQ